jgi:hypothetical protein
MKSLAAADRKDRGLDKVLVGSVKTKSKQTGNKNHSAGKFQAKKKKSPHFIICPGRMDWCSRKQVGIWFLYSVGRTMAARKSKEKEIGQHAGARKTQATNGDFPAEEQSTRSKT